jgi:YVTN family beta-propeller protein
VPQVTIPDGNNPQDLAIDTSTHTAYVTNGNDATVSVINTAVCNAVATAGCEDPLPVIHIADPNSFPASVALDAATQTLYVADANDNTVAVIDTATCNASTTVGCGQTPPVMTTGAAPFNIALDPTTHTLFTANFADGSVSVLDTADCNGQVTSGCGQTPGTIGYGTAQPSGLLMDVASHTLYVANLALTSSDPSEVDTVALVDTSRCNAETTIGCTGTGPSLVVGTGSSDANVGMALDPYASTLYVANPVDNTVSLVDLRHCTASDSSGCGQVAPTAPTAGGFAVDLTYVAQSDTLYVTAGGNNTVSVLDAAACNALRTNRCAEPAGTIRGGIDLGAPRFDPTTATLYLVPVADVDVVNAATCNGRVSRGCFTPAPTVHVGSVPDGIAVDPLTHTAYVVNGGDGTVSVIDTRKCAAQYAAHCPTTLPTIHGVDAPHGIAVDAATDTVYVTDNGGENIVSVINGATCNASITTGCGQTPATVTVGQASYGIVDDSATHTAYVTNDNSNTVSVIDTRHCRSGDTSGCSQTPATVKVGVEPLGITLDQATHTVYVADIQDGALSVIDTRACQAANTAGCGAAMPTVAAGVAPRAVVVDPANGTLYVADVADNLVAILNARTCRAADTSGCSQTPGFVRVGAAPDAIAVNSDGSTVYVADLLDNTVSVIRADACNAGHLANSCTGPAPVLAVGDGPQALAFDQATHTLYVTNGYDYGVDDSVSVLPTA